MNIELLIQYMSYLLIAVGALAFLVSAITQAVKEMPGLKNLPTNAVVLAISIILCPLAMVVVCQYMMIAIVWYYVIASILAAFVVYLVATGGWEKVKEMWSRFTYKK